MLSGQQRCPECGDSQPYRGGAVRGFRVGGRGVDVTVTCDTCREVRNATTLYQKRRLRIPHGWRGRLPGVRGACERCHRGAPHAVSRFNRDWLCQGCFDRESRHPEFRAAEQEIETRARRYDFNYEGPGLPPDLRPI